ncbi:MAG: hypothetical protein JXA71_10505 [Chitinispirillaceae bacterium]|nr:hypothetical protein [Chitinispirillaceae bacterium]
MRINRLVTSLFCIGALLVLSCGDGVDNGNGQMDTSVVGYWEGVMEPITLMGFKGASIFNHIRADSTFLLVTLDTSRSDTSRIKDTTLYLAGKWRLNEPKDSILLLPDTCRIIDTAQNILVPRAVSGETIPMFVFIIKNDATGQIEWTVFGTDLVPLGPLLGIDLSGVPTDLLKIITIALYKRRQY